MAQTYVSPVGTHEYRLLMHPLRQPPQWEGWLRSVSHPSYERSVQ
jgi:hypothetical protein